jgi:hypothetical protein
MNEDHVKIKLIEIEEPAEDFTVIFSGRMNKKYDGFYYPDKKEILIHDRNFIENNQLIYTAIHEYAHHIQYCKTTAPVSTRAHTVDFWSIFHKLLFAAEEKGIYVNVFETIPEFQELTERLKRDYLSRNGELMKEFGKLLLEAQELCRRHHASFEDYVDRVLRLHRSEAKTIMKTFSMDIKPENGYENMKTVAKIKDEDARAGVEMAFMENFNTPDMVKAEMSRKEQFDSRLSFLEAEERGLSSLLKNLQQDLPGLKEILMQ